MIIAAKLSLKGIVCRPSLLAGTILMPANDLSFRTDGNPVSCGSECKTAAGIDTNVFRSSQISEEN